jgi:hypothetical protein
LRGFSTRELHKRLHTHRTIDAEQINLNEKSPTCGAFHFPDSRIVVFPRVGHSFGIGGCVDEMMVDLVDRGTTTGLDTTRCAGAVVVPPFPLTG